MQTLRGHTQEVGALGQWQCDLQEGLRTVLFGHPLPLDLRRRGEASGGAPQGGAAAIRVEVGVHRHLLLDNVRRNCKKDIQSLKGVVVVVVVALATEFHDRKQFHPSGASCGQGVALARALRMAADWLAALRKRPCASQMIFSVHPHILPPFNFLF